MLTILIDSLAPGPGQGTIISSSAQATNTGSAAPQGTGSSASSSVTSAPASGSGSASASGSGSKSGSSKATQTYTTSYDPRLPPGGVSMLIPAATLGPQYYKIGDYVTFGWNYTSLLATPTAVDIVASCAGNHQTYTLAMNQTVTNATQGVVWDTAAYQSSHPSVPLAQEVYTLIIYDAASAITAVPRAGYLAPQAQYTFGMYTPEPYQNSTDGYMCATCSGALSDMERKALGFMFTMGLITVMSFTWFIGGFDIIW
jgi:hypothetical protein